MKLNRFFRRNSDPRSNQRSNRVKQSMAKSVLAARPMSMEQLEDRQMMSVTLDLHVASTGGKTATVTSVGQSVLLVVDAIVSGNTSGTNDGFVSAIGSFLSTMTNSSTSVKGDLSANVLSEYAANGAAEGDDVDLNGDGNIDVGSNNNGDSSGFFSARSTEGVADDGTVSGDTQTFIIATVSYKVTSLSYGQATDINFRFRNGTLSGAYDAVWWEDGKGANDGPLPGGTGGTALLGAPVVITDPNLSPPALGSIAGTVSKVVSGSVSTFSGVTMDLLSGTNIVASTTTSSTGTYSFSGLAAGTYAVKEVVPTGYTETSPSGNISVSLSAGQNLTSQNFTDTAVVAATGSISGTVSKVVSGTTSAFAGVTVYLDANNNGTLDSGETSTTTSSTGTYSFSGLAAGTYHVREVVPTGYSQTTPTTSPTTITLTAGQNSTSDNFTDTSTTTVPPAGTASISGFVYVDKNKNGVFDSGEVGLAGVTMYIDKNNNSIPDAGDTIVTTSSTGAYSFTGLATGTYVIREVLPTGSKLIAPGKGYANVGVQNGWTITGENFGDSAPTVVPTTGSIAGTVTQIVSGASSAFVGVTVFLDTNNNGVLDSGETSAITSSTGTYSFAGLPAGTYVLREVVPAGYTQTTPASSITVNLAAGANATGESFVDTAKTVTPTTGTISGTVSKVVSGVTSAFAGVTVYLDANNNGTVDSGEIIATTSSTGTYSFSGLAAGTYHVREVVPSGYSQTSPTTTPTTVILTAGQNATGDNFTDTATAVIPPAGTASISGFVYVDKNNNGKFDSGEVGLSGVTMYIDKNNDSVPDAGDTLVTTSSTGAYSFTGLATGTYVIREVLPMGSKLITPGKGYASVGVQNGWTITGENFGDTAPPATAKSTSGIASNASSGTSTAITLSGEVFNDTNGNGVLDAGETGLSGWTVYCDLNDDGKFTPNESYKITSSSGKYSFTALQPGTYYLRVVPETGYTGTVPNGFFTVVLTAGSNIVDNFGEKA